MQRSEQRGEQRRVLFIVIQKLQYFFQNAQQPRKLLARLLACSVATLYKARRTAASSLGT